jgi:hypothetical protein
MRTIVQAALALGVAGALALGTPTAAKAQIITYNGPGVGIESITYPDGHWHFRHNRDYDYRPYAFRERYRDYDDRRDAYYRAGEVQRRYYTSDGCLWGYTLREGVCTQ